MTGSPQSAKQGPQAPPAKASSPAGSVDLHGGEAHRNPGDAMAPSTPTSAAQTSDLARQAHLELIAMNRGCCA